MKTASLISLAPLALAKLLYDKTRGRMFPSHRNKLLIVDDIQYGNKYRVEYSIKHGQEKWRKEVVHLHPSEDTPMARLLKSGKFKMDSNIDPQFMWWTEGMRGYREWVDNEKT